MLTKRDILEKFAPQFVALDEAEEKATEGPWEAVISNQDDCEDVWVQVSNSETCITYIFEEVGQKSADAVFTAEARNQTRSLLDAYAQALSALEFARHQMQIAMNDCSVTPANRADAENLRRHVRDRLKKCLSNLPAPPSQKEGRDA